MLVTFRLKTAFIGAVLCGLLVVHVFTGTAELFRYRFQTKDGRAFEYLFESSAEPSPQSITREEATRIATNWNVLPFAAWQCWVHGISREAASALARLLCRYRYRPESTPAFRRGDAGRKNRSAKRVGEIVEMRGREQGFPG
jgi:hypothetical protein